MPTKISQIQFRVLSGLYLVTVYSFGIFSRSAWSDDYPSLLDPSGNALFAARNGRPVYGGVAQVLFSQFNSIDALVVIRLIGFIGLLMLNDLLIRNFLRAELSIRVAVAVTIAFTLPSFQFSSHWATAYMMSWSAYLAVLALELSKASRVNIKLLGTLALVCSLLFYPLFSFFLFAYIYALWFVKSQPIKLLITEILRGVYLVIICSGLAYLFSFIYLTSHNLTFNPRVGLVSISALSDKLFFFVTRPFALTYRPFFIDSPSTKALIISLLSFVTLLLLLFWRKNRSFATTFIQFLVFNIVVILTLTPLIFVSENQIDMRFIAPNTWLFAFVVMFSLFPKDLERSGNTKIFDKFRIAFLGMSLVAGMISINYNFINLYLTPFHVKEVFIHQQLAFCSAEKVRSKISIVERTIPWEKRNNIGAYSQQTDLESAWVPIGAVFYYLRNIGLQTDSLSIVADEEDQDNGCFVVLDEYPKLFG
jgi:hypothetical protein